MKLPKRKPHKAENNPLTSQFWLLKSEPDVFSWDMLVGRGKAGEPWTGVRNYLARNHMRAMQIGDLGFFYHSNIGKEIVGILRVIALAHPDQDDTTGTWECVDVEAVCPLPVPVTLAAVKADAALAKMALVTSMRLSVQPVATEEWTHVCALGGLDPAKLNASTTGKPTKLVSAKKTSKAKQTL
jgi:predicted RNA-binding protein with PUA-like domain